LNGLKVERLIMRNEIIAEFEHRIRATSDEAEVEEILQEAKALLSLEEYTTLLGRLQQPAETGGFEADDSDQSP
jgi:hypothetical protein